MNRKFKTVAIAAYVMIAIATFGHAAANRQAADESQYLECRKAEHAICFRENWGSFSGLFAAPLWPLYWSWEAWS